MPPKPKRLVKSIDAMDDETLINHFNARHMPIKGLERVALRESDPGERLLRTYHTHVHHRGIDDADPKRPVNHDHE